MFENFFNRKKKDVEVKKEEIVPVVKSKTKKRKRRSGIEVGKTRPELDIYQTELFATLDELHSKGSADGRLKVTLIRDVINAKLPEGVELHSRTVANMLRGLKLIVIVGSQHCRFLLWEPTRLKRIFRKFEIKQKKAVAPVEPVENTQMSLDIPEEVEQTPHPKGSREAVRILGENQSLLLSTLFKHRNKVNRNGRLKILTVSKTLNKILPVTKNISTRAVRESLETLGLKTDKGSDNYLSLIWEHEKMKDLLSPYGTVSEKKRKQQKVVVEELSPTKSKYAIKKGSPEPSKTAKKVHIYERFPFDELAVDTFFTVEKDDVLFGKVHNAITTYKRKYKTKDFAERTSDTGGLEVYRIK